jgi:pSer/pThr/pTyr-binding forkhead associated (FHA) protein
MSGKTTHAGGSTPARRPTEVVCLRGLSPRVAGQMFAIDNVKIVGRSPRCDVVLDDASVSRTHAVLAPEPDGGSLHVSDMGSGNGTWVNDVRITGRAVVSSGDRLNIGRLAFVVVLRVSGTRRIGGGG